MYYYYNTCIPFKLIISKLYFGNLTMMNPLQYEYDFVEEGPFKHSYVDG